MRAQPALFCVGCSTSTNLHKPNQKSIESQKRNVKVSAQSRMPVWSGSSSCQLAEEWNPVDYCTGGPYSLRLDGASGLFLPCSFSGSSGTAPVVTVAVKNSSCCSADSLTAQHNRWRGWSSPSFPAFWETDNSLHRHSRLSFRCTMN